MGMQLTCNGQTLGTWNLHMQNRESDIRLFHKSKIDSILNYATLNTQHGSFDCVPPNENVEIDSSLGFELVQYTEHRSPTSMLNAVTVTSGTRPTQ